MQATTPETLAVEAATGGVLLEKVLLKISQNSQENACATRPQACNFIKKETLAQVLSCEFCEISKNTFFTEHLWATASVAVRNVDEIMSEHFEKVCRYLEDEMVPVTTSQLHLKLIVLVETEEVYSMCTVDSCNKRHIL